MATPFTLSRDISPPPRRKTSNSLVIKDITEPTQKLEARNGHSAHETDREPDPTLAAIEAGHAQIRNHLEFFAKDFRETLRPDTSPRLTIHNFEILCKRNQHSHGRHFVVHQHDHPISGISSHPVLRFVC